MNTFTKHATSTVRAMLRGGPTGLNAIGSALEKASRYVAFEARALRSAAAHRIAVTPSDGSWLASRASNLVYDFGANRGLNFNYYFDRGLDIIAVEANPALCASLQSRFASQITAGRLTIVNACLWDEVTAADIEFYVSDASDVLSTSVAAAMVGDPADYHMIRVGTRRPSDLFREFGHPLYVKIDVEGLDARLLSEIFRNYAPPIEHISAESHDIGTFANLVAAGYTQFKIVEGQFVSSPRYAIKSSDGQDYRFPEHAAGPFGDDIPGEWLSSDMAFEYLREHGLGWKDIHATGKPV